MKRKYDFGLRNVGEPDYIGMTERRQAAIKARSMAAVGMPVTFKTNDTVYHGRISGIYRHICAVKIPCGHGSRIECFNWYDIGKMLRAEGYKT